jgi:hypothetical protein
MQVRPHRRQRRAGAASLAGGDRRSVPARSRWRGAAAPTSRWKFAATPARFTVNVWAHLQELGWLGPTPWLLSSAMRRVDRKASMVARRCEILDFWHAFEHARELPCAPWRRLQRLACDSFKSHRLFNPANRWRSWTSGCTRSAEGLHGGKVHQVIARLEGLRPAGMRWSARSAPADS